jgi:hypothetical protein
MHAATLPTTTRPDKGLPPHAAARTRLKHSEDRLFMRQPMNFLRERKAILLSVAMKDGRTDMGEVLLLGTIVMGVGLAVVAARMTLRAIVNAMPVGHKARVEL